MTTYNLQHANAQAPAFSIASILAVVCAVFSFSTAAGWSLLLAVSAIVLGAIGMLIAFLPSRRGGVVSALAIGGGSIGILVAILRLLASAV